MRYKYIAIEGNIGAGKTSLATRVAADNNARLVLEEFADNPFLPKFYKEHDRYAFPLELSFLAERFAQLKKELGSPDLFQQAVVSDYFISKSLIFSKANLAGDEYDLFAKLYSIIEPTLPKPELLLYIHLPADLLLENIRKRGRGYEQDITAKYLEGVQHSYFEFIRQHETMRIVIVDTTSLDFVNSPADYEQMCRLIDTEFPLGITRIGEDDLT
jgi:deoxyguanosine kinase